MASLVSLCPVTPVALPTLVLSPPREVLVEMANGQWPRRHGAYTGYESMKGLIRLCVDAREATGEEECGSGESDKEHAKVERLLVPHPLEC